VRPRLVLLRSVPVLTEYLLAEKSCLGDARCRLLLENRNEGAPCFCQPDRLYIGPHALRHTVATRLLRRGASMKEIADVLRHRSIDTAAIYAKVDLGTLGEVAARWPGRIK
jgi:integrase